LAIDRFWISTSRPLNVDAANNANHFELRHDGADGIYGTTDDVVHDVQPTYAAGTRTIQFTVSPAPLQPGRHRFRTTSALLDGDGDSVATFEREFTVVRPAFGELENSDNGALPGATLLPMVE